MIFEAASRATDEELALAVLSSYALEKEVCSISDLATYLSEYTINSMLSLYSNTKVNSQKAAIIKTNPLLIRIFKLIQAVEEKYKSNEHKDLFFQIEYPGNEGFDISQRFKPNLEIKDNVLEGFGGDGWLGFYEYTISGRTFPDLALDIIRLTIDDPCNTEVQGIELGRSYRHMDLNFLNQYWFTSDIAPVWCYPDGTIYCNGYKAGQTIQDIIMEACCLAEEFKTLNMNISIQSRNGEWIIDDDAIVINIESGKVKASVGHKPLGTTNEFTVRANELRQQKKPVFTMEQLKAMQLSNECEHFMKSEQGKKVMKLKEYFYTFDRDIAMRLNSYMLETRGLPLIVGSTPVYNLLTYIFDYDMDKLKQYHEAYENRRKAWLAEKGR